MSHDLYDETVVSQKRRKPLPEIPTIEEVIEYALSLDPKRAQQLTNGSMEAECSTPTITKVRVNGEILDLTLVRGLYAVGYCRVSTLVQGEDGWSVKDQIKRAVYYFIEKGWAFRLVSDATLGGSLPPNDPDLIRELCRYKSVRFGKVFYRVFLSKYVTDYTPKQKEPMRKYMEDRMNEILRGAEGADDTEISDATDGQERTGKSKGRPRKRPAFRPGLTVVRANLKSIHTLAMTGLSRISRSSALTVVLSKEFVEMQIRLIGFVEPFPTGGDTDDETDTESADLVFTILRWVAEQKLTEVCSNSLRGLKTMLESGFPHSRLPFWCVRVKDENGKTVRIDEHPEGMKAAKALVQFYLEEAEEADGGYGTVSSLLVQGDYMSPTGKGWDWRTIRSVLETRTLVGEQVIFGIPFPGIIPAVCDELTFAKIDARMKRRKPKGGRPALSGDAYLATGLVRCAICGNTLIAVKNRKQYACRFTLHRRDDKEALHTVLNMEDVDRFINDLMLTHPISLIQTITGTDESDTLLYVLNAELQKLGDCEADLKAAEDSAQRNALDHMTKQGYTTTHPMYSTLLKTLVEAETFGVGEQVATKKKIVGRAQKAYDAYEPPLGYVDYAEQLQRWPDLTNKEKNTILRRLFIAFWVQGTEPQQHILAERRTSDTQVLPPIRLIVTANGKKWIRRLPSAQEWWWAVRKHLKGAEWYGGFQNFAWTTDLTDEDEQEAVVDVVPWDESK